MRESDFSKQPTTPFRLTSSPIKQRRINGIVNEGEFAMRQAFVNLASEDGQDIAEYAVMVAVILLIVVGTLRLIGSNANTVFSQAASSIG